MEKSKIEILKENSFLLSLLIIGAVSVSYLCGEDAALDEISYAERLRVMCATPGHNETLCHNTAQGRDHDK